MDVCINKFEYEEAFEVVDLDHIQSILHFDSIGEEIDIFDMTSLSTLVLMSQADTKSSYFRDINLKLYNKDENFRLTVAYEKLHAMPKLLLQELSPIVRTLDISHNEFDNLDFLNEFKKLSMLICDHNNITSYTTIPPIPGLELLWMNYCKITDLYPWAKRLQQSCPNLKHLSLMGNPAAPSYLNGGTFYEYLQYRLFMISLFPNLVHLDDKAVTEDQRAEAHRMYKRPLLERITSRTQNNLPTYLRSVTDKFTDMLNPFPANAAPQKNIII